MKKYLQLALAICLVLALTAVGIPPAVFADEEETVSIRIVHTNDSHGRYAAGETCVGYAKLQTIAEGDGHRADLILDAGDAFHGLSFATVEQGAGVAELFKTIGYTAMTPGLADLSYGTAHLNELETDSGTPILSCNLLDGTSAQPVFTPSVGLTVQGVRIGLIGVTSPDLLGELEMEDGQSLILADPAACVQQEIDRLRKEGCTMLIVLAHMGDSSLWPWTGERLISETEGIDVLIDGRSHTEENRMVSWKNGEGQALCVQTGAYLENVGVLTLEVDRGTGRPVNLSTSCEDLISAGEAMELEEDAGIAAQIALIEKRQSVLSASSAAVSSRPASSAVRSKPVSPAVSSSAAVSSQAVQSSPQSEPPAPAEQGTWEMFPVFLAAAVVVLVAVFVLLSRRGQGR
ncbi:bifunctional metallophosphatase/5'-nucleotidase [Anaeromassilibacillus sp. An200]|uniref:bifunctional metallophosphatase/5'-nucleotidase n=1 Tax=Anaeromassilibacillus sp. An200 TaxID=1965587 RepID=UPI000B39C15F|nr:hypothetical protein [Anaeromassilibacillus sp. An200]OUP08284.1 hypothetical protein B5F35_13455 [Anaeromassilibacillus sp. An200]